MKPDDITPWLPIIRDITALVAGLAVGVIGLVTSDLSLATIGFAGAGYGAWGRTAAQKKPEVE